MPISSNPLNQGATLDESLIEAVLLGKFSEVVACLDAGANPNAVDKDGFSVLITAVCNAPFGVCEVLLKRGADVHTRDREQLQALHHGMGVATVEICALLIEWKADVHAVDHEMKTPLHHGVWSGPEHCQLVIDHEADVKAVDAVQNSALHDAARWGHTGPIRTLVMAGCPVNVKGEKRQAPLHLAAAHKQVRACVELLNLDASVAVLDGLGRTPMRRAVAVGHGAVCLELLPPETDLSRHEQALRQAIDWANFDGQGGVAQMLKTCQSALAAREAIRELEMGFVAAAVDLPRPHHLTASAPR